MTRTKLPPTNPDPFEGALAALADEPPGPVTQTVHGVRQVTVTWGEEVIQPIQYNGFRVGPLSMTSDVLPHETPREAVRRIWKLLDELGREQFEEKLKSFMQNAKTAGQAARSRA